MFPIRKETLVSTVSIPHFEHIIEQAFAVPCSLKPFADDMTLFDITEAYQISWPEFENRLSSIFSLVQNSSCSLDEWQRDQINLKVDIRTENRRQEFPHTEKNLVPMTVDLLKSLVSDSKKGPVLVLGSEDRDGFTGSLYLREMGVTQARYLKGGMANFIRA
ncbi:rhodanese-like domain-containing protein [Pseudobacteriovorax antillogorgiicola]|uniref:Rhodanese domain-containing protein n=1 Tax=Pseudobacteriovorax antillogorgiicola TaxID=1513793 RepID=A0A1Y6BNR8_9BACT|nr:rhodanese-like domain-containing protein [Pseudobacteriovorax antillogorgiicola]TCS53850.1 hypothetical protein EDD56_107159 [Pseudobacteriovorax antillogorgiicola]SMF21579.1 hypothetical protein SAMN06296036_107113 [Pseudobacteriovorax antillogorgiicola]